MLSERATDRGRTDDRLFRSSPQRRVASGNDNTSKQLGAQDRGVIAQIGRENGNEVATQERASAACRHALPAWVYETETKHPRAYGQCLICRSYVVVLLPPQLGGWNSYSYESPERIDRSSCFCQILLTLSEDEPKPTKAATLHRLLGFSEQAIRDSLATLVAHGFIERVSTGHYIRRWAPIPGIEA